MEKFVFLQSRKRAIIAVVRFMFLDGKLKQKLFHIQTVIRLYKGFTSVLPSVLKHEYLLPNPRTIDKLTCFQLTKLFHAELLPQQIQHCTELFLYQSVRNTMTKSQAAYGLL